MAIMLFGRGDFSEVIAKAENEAAKIRLDILKNRNVGRRVRVRPLSVRSRRRDYLAYDDTH